MMMISSPSPLMLHLRSRHKCYQHHAPPHVSTPLQRAIAATITQSTCRLLYYHLEHHSASCESTASKISSTKVLPAPSRNFIQKEHKEGLTIVHWQLTCPFWTRFWKDAATFSLRSNPAAYAHATVDGCGTVAQLTLQQHLQLSQHYAHNARVQVSMQGCVQTPSTANTCLSK